MLIRIFLAGIILPILSLSPLHCQRDYSVHWVGFKDKKDSPYSLLHPQEFLSARSIERRQRQGIWLDSTDLPVNPQYLNALTQAGLEICFPSKWLNGAAVIGKKDQVEAAIKGLEFVKEHFPIGFLRKSQYPKTGVGARDYKTTGFAKFKNPYGGGQNQIQMLNGHYIHGMGFRGKDMHVAVMDGGFNYMPETPAFDSLFVRGQILDMYDFLERDPYVFESSEHGTDVLSTMAANLPNLLVGTAPDAWYYLYKTEDELGEYLQEEFVWVRSLEYADSIGVWVVNTSLGYYDFDDNTMDYAYVDLDGAYAPMSRAASMGGRKGLLIVTSAGNEGDNAWKHITVPGDARDVLTIGAVDRDGFRAKFSSVGFSARDYIKPDLMARGHTAIVAARSRYDTRYQYGTSFSSPIMAGMVTSLWQACPWATSRQIRAALQRSADRFDRPDTLYGYGIPNFLTAYSELSPTVVRIESEVNSVHYFCAAEFPLVDVFLERIDGNAFSVEMTDLPGKSVFKAEYTVTPEMPAYCRLELSALPPGLYVAYIRAGKITHRILIGTGSAYRP